MMPFYPIFNPHVLRFMLSNSQVMSILPSGAAQIFGHRNNKPKNKCTTNEKQQKKIEIKRIKFKIICN